jgi:hypothetical protein
MNEAKEINKVTSHICIKSIKNLIFAKKNDLRVKSVFQT